MGTASPVASILLAVENYTVKTGFDPIARCSIYAETGPGSVFLVFPRGVVTGAKHKDAPWLPLLDYQTGQHLRFFAGRVPMNLTGANEP